MKNTMICIGSKKCSNISCPHKNAHEEDYNCRHGNCNGKPLPCRIYPIKEIRKDKINNITLNT